MKSRMVRLVGVCAFSVAVALPATVSGQTSVPSPWISTNIGGASPSGTATYDPQQQLFSISAGGTDIWDTSDQFRFVYQKISASIDFDVIARIDSFSPVDPWSKIGVMVRDDLTAGSAHALMLLSGSRGIWFQRRTQDGGLAETFAGDQTAVAPRWVRISLVGTTLTGYFSVDGGTWQKINTATIPLGDSAYVGLAITSHNPGSLASAVLSNVAVTPRGLPVGQQTQDIGSPAVAGTTSYSNGTYTVTAAGKDIQSTSDQFRFVDQPVSGDVDIIARVKSIQNVNRWSKAGVMIRETLDANARETMALMSASRGYSFQWRSDPGGGTSYVRFGGYVAPAWVRLVRTGPKFEAFRSSDGATWTSMGSQIISMASTVYVGLAVTSHDATTAATAVFDQLKIVQASPSVNQPPTVTLTSPPSASGFIAPANITVSATAADPENRLSRVDFFANQTLIGSSTAAPYSISWTSVPVGTYSLTAKAFDADGGSATSAAATINVNAANQPPVVTLTAPTAGATFTTGASVSLSATASDPEGRLARVEFYVGTTLVATDTAGPFTATWTAGSAGTYAVKAIAYDADGAQTTSPVVSISVTTATTAPRFVVFHESSDNDTLVTSYRLDVFANGANPATATAVATSNLGKPTPDANGDITVDRATFFSALAPGTYVATVSAVGSAGSSSSASVTFVR